MKNVTNTQTEKDKIMK